ncbi:tyrosine-type recombinase/integrase [Clostridium sp.]|uniref:tyrosine-type recombinase/integrase n=1 Tax=Clostridium sp. TaxID=1506 RepID=UPI0032173817
MKIQKLINNTDKYNEMIEYLKQQGNGYWLESDIWDFYSKFNYDLDSARLKKHIDFTVVRSNNLILELKYGVIYGLKNHYFNPQYIINNFQAFIKKIQKYNDKNQINSIVNIDINKFNLFLINVENLTEHSAKNYIKYSKIFNIILTDFYDDREEFEKDIWDCYKINGVRIPGAGFTGSGHKSLIFIRIPIYYRNCVKRYLRTIITKMSVAHCMNVLKAIEVFFLTFYKMGYSDGFLKNISRDDIEKYIYEISNKYKSRNVTYYNKFISHPRIFLKYIQIAEYDEAPIKEISHIIFYDDIPKREKDSDRLKRVKFIPEPILKQLDNHIMDLDRTQFIPIYILLRETGWRGTDILNLRYDNCLEQIWNSKEQIYNYYLCGEITKTGIAQLKIPIRDKVAEMVQNTVNKAKELSTEDNNPKKYLFNTYEGRLTGKTIHKRTFVNCVQRLIDKADIRNENGELYHFRVHSLRHTRAKEYIEQGMGISVIQQILGHTSLQMTVHYATVSENTLYEKWKDTEDLELFKVNTETNELIEVDTSTDAGENLIRYEYVKKNLDAVRVPFGVCFKPSKLPCKQQMNHCLTCASFCTTTENIPEYEEEIQKVKYQIEISDKFGRELWAEKNTGYLELLEKTLGKIREYKLVHKNDKSREDS